MRDQLLRRIASGHHPAPPRADARPRDPREERAAFKRQLRALVGDGALVLVRGNRYGLADRMDLVVGRLEPIRPGSASSTPERPIEGVKGDIYVAAPNLQGGAARRPRGRPHRAPPRRRPGRRPHRAGPRARARRRIVGRFDVDESGLGFVVPFDRRAARRRPHPARRDARTPSRARWSPSRSRAGRRRRAARSAASSKCSAASTSPASTPRSSCASTAFRTSTRDEAVEEARRLGTAVARSDIAGPHRFPRPHRRHHRRRGRARFRRCDLDRAAAERPLSGSACTSPTWRTTCARAARSTARRTSAARRCTFPSAPCTCFRRRSRPACAASGRTSIGWCSRA